MCCGASIVLASARALAAEISSRLKRADVAHCRIDGDWLDLAYPQADPALSEDNFRTLWRNYRERGYTRMIYSNVAGVIHADRIARLVGRNPATRPAHNLPIS
jgi:hypothetical protein